VGPAATAGIVGEECLGDLVVTAGVEDPMGLVDMMVAMEGTIAGLVDITGIMAGLVDIMVEAISTEDPGSTSADTLGSPTTIRTVIILTPITILTPTHLLITRML
jgi:hypothetical protein